MASLDLGPLAPPLLFFGGPLGNLQAVKALREEARRRHIPPSSIVCTGDLIGYCADGEAVVDLIRDWGIHVVAGNCDVNLAEDQDECGCGFAAGSACDTLSKRWFDHARHTVDRANKDWLGRLPGSISFSVHGWKAVVLHGGLRDISQFVFASTPEAEKSAILGEAEADIVVAGHCGLPFSQRIGPAAWHNAGVIGMPANDGTPDTWFSLLTAHETGIGIDHHRLVYDWEEARRRLLKAGLPDAYADNLSAGLWPNMDILPAEERLQRGMALAPAGIELDDR